MHRIFVKKENLEERKKQYEECLRFLYYVEDIFDYDYEIISKCIDELLYNLEIKEDKRFSVEVFEESE